MDITIAIDKLDKIGIEKKSKRRITRARIKWRPDKNNRIFLKHHGKQWRKNSRVKKTFDGKQTGLEGIEELNYIISHLTNLGSPL